MATTYSSAGIDFATYAEIVADRITAAEAQWSDSINTAEDEWLGHNIRLDARGLADTNAAAQQLIDALNISNASGTILDFLVALIGITRSSAAYSTATLTITPTETTTVPAGTQYSTSAGVIFATDSELALTGTTPGTVASTCTVVGPNEAAAGTITTIVNSVFGVASVTNAADASPGSLRQTDAQLKAAHTSATSTTGQNDAASIKEAVSALTGVSSVYVFSNNTTGAIGVVPAYHVYVTVIGGTDAAIAAAIDDNLSATTPTHGATTVSVYNATTKQAKNINFDAASNVPIYIDMTLTTLAGVFPDDGSDQIKALLVADFANFDIADDVPFDRLYKSIYSVAGISSIDSLTMDIVDGSTGLVDIVIDQTERATLATASIDITIS
jgi:uncharacterized phage protein gp47/JayE